MSLSTVFDICMPRQDVLDHSFTEADFAADLASVLREDGPEEYRDPVKFFARSYPTEGLKILLRSVCSRLTGGSESIAPIFRLDTNYGGGKTHALIALAHAARGMRGVANVSEFIDPSKLPSGAVRVASFDGENADPYNGNPLEGGLRAYTPWGEIAYALAGREGYEKVRKSDESGGAPGAGTIKELFGNQPTLILLDELSIYLRKLKRDSDRSGGQLTAFLTSLFKAVESSPRAAVVYTLAIGKGGVASDAYRQENMDIADAMAEAESVSARKATLLDPTEENETVKVLQRRLFEQVDEPRLDQLLEAFKRIWDHNKPLLTQVGATDTRLEDFRDGFPFHPELIATLRNKTATLNNFQRVRGMLRILGRTVGRLWDKRPPNTFAIHLHHIDPGFEPIRQEVVTRLGQGHLLPALRADVAAAEGEENSLAEKLDADHYQGLLPYASMVARTIFFHTLAFNEQLKGASREEIRYSIISPERDISFIDDATTRFIQHSAYLDDRPNVPLRFQAEANLTQIIKRQEENVDTTELREQLNDRIREIYTGKTNTFNTIPFPGGPYDVPDDASQGRPALVVIGYDAADISAETLEIAELVERIYRHHGSGGDVRINRNNIFFLLGDSERKDQMRRMMRRHLALKDLLRPERLKELAEHQQEKMREMAKRSEQELALAIQQCYRHVLYPSKNRVEGAKVDLAHAAIEVHTASQTPGDGQKHVIQVLRDSRKLRLPEDDPDSPSYVRDKTPLKRGGITTSALRREFFRDPALPVLVGNEVFLRGLRQGIEEGSYVYQSGDLIWAQGMPYAEIKVDENSMVYTSEYAKEQGIWPRPAPPPPPPPRPDDEKDGGGDDGPIRAPRRPIEPGGDGTGTDPPPPPPPPVSDISAEGPLKEALTSLWEKARSRKIEKVGILSLQLYDPFDGFKVMVLANGIPGAGKLVDIQGGYETAADGELTLEFKGPIDDAQPIKDFLEPQLRAATDKDFKVSITVEFNGGLDLSGSEPEKLTERLGKFGSGAAYVSASAKGGDA